MIQNYFCKRKKINTRFSFCFHAPLTMPLFYVFLSVVPGIKPRALHVLGQSPVSELRSQSPLLLTVN